MGQPKTFDIFIVGNGAVGLALAHRLLGEAPGVRVAVAGPADRAGGASLAAGAMLNAWGELVRGQMADTALAERARLAIEALPLWAPLCAELSADAPLRAQRGAVLRDTAAGALEAETLREIEAALARAGLPVSRDARGLWIPDGWIDAGGVIAAYDAAIAALGATRFDAMATAVARDGSAWRVETAAGARFAAGAVVLANGPFAQALLDGLPEAAGEIPRLAFEAGGALTATGAPAMPGVLRTVERGAAGGFHLVPRAGGEAYLGATSAVSLAAAPPAAGDLARLPAMLAEAGEAALAALDWRPSAIGYRAIAADGFPLLGETHLAGLWLAAGFRRDGFTASPWIARELAAALLRRPHALPARFMPARRLISYKTRAAAIADAAEGRGEAGRERLERLYDRRGLESFGVHPALIGLYESDVDYARIRHPCALA
ncbi:MAG: FAD-dependent oxidoreductase [Hyphomonadaceae bacterium]